METKSLLADLRSLFKIFETWFKHGKQIYRIEVITKLRVLRKFQQWQDLQFYVQKHKYCCKYILVGYQGGGGELSNRSSRLKIPKYLYKHL